MPIEPAQLFLSLLMAIGIYAFVVGATLIAGGMSAVRRQRRALLLIGLVLVAIALVIPALESQSGGLIGAALLAVSVLLVGVRMTQLRSAPPEVRERGEALRSSPRFRLLVAAFIGFMIVMSILAASLGRLSAK